MTTTGGIPLPAMSVEPRSVSPSNPATRATPNRAAPAMSTRPARRGVSQSGEAAQARTRAIRSDRDVEVEDPAPGRGQDVGGLSRHAGCRQRRLRVDRCEDRRPDDRAGRHPEEGERPDDAERPRTRRATEQVGGGGRADRDEDPAADALDEARRDELVERLRRARQRGADDEDDQRPHEQPSDAPQVGQPAGDRHRQDVDQQVAVDDPAGLSQLDPGGPAVRAAEVLQDRREGDRGHHELEPGQEYADPDDGQQHVCRTTVHRPSVGGEAGSGREAHDRALVGRWT